MRKPLTPNHAPGSGRAPRVTARFSADAIAAVDRLAERRGLERSAILRAAVEAYLENQAEVAQKTA